jgi:hypothetical protein
LDLTLIVPEKEHQIRARKSKTTHAEEQPKEKNEVEL